MYNSAPSLNFSDVDMDELMSILLVVALCIDECDVIMSRHDE